MAGGLKRRIGPLLLTAYGLGVMVGAGIYVLIGTVVASAGIWAPAAFLAAGLIAALSALSYAEFTTRVPEAAGAASYIEEGLGLRWLGLVAGLAVALSGMVSAAAVLKGGVGYLVGVVPLPELTAILVLGALLTFVAILGVLESLSLAALLTAIEVIGLLIAGWAGFSAEPAPDWQSPAPPVWAGLAAATALAFFAFIGFEDMANMTEEVKNPARTVPFGIIAALVLTTLLYAFVAIAAVRAVPAEQLAASRQPLALVWAKGSGLSPAWLSAIAVAAALNGVLAQIVMAARVLFGLGRRHPSLAVFHRAHARFGTPVGATLLAGAGTVAGALLLPVDRLADLTSTMLLAVFALVNLALILIKRRAPESDFRLPVWVPAAGLVTALAALGASLWLPQ